MGAILRWACGATMAMVAGGCGGRTPIEDCGPIGPVSFHRPDRLVRCQREGKGLLSIESPEDWYAHCGEDEPPVDFSRETLIAYFLEDDCTYSGCNDRLSLITAMTKRGCTLVIEARNVAPGELGACDACGQPHDFVVVSRRDALGVIEVEGP